MTNKQLLKRLQYQQNRLFDLPNYSFYLAINNSIELGIYFSVWIHDGNKNQEIIFTNNFNIKDKLLDNKLNRLKNIIDDLLNKQTII